MDLVVQIQRERGSLVPRAVQCAAHLVQAASDAFDTPLDCDGQHVLELFGGAVEIVAAEPGCGEVQPGQTQLTEAALLRGVGLRTCLTRGQMVLGGAQGRRPVPGASRRVMSPIMAHLTMASWLSGSRS